MAGTQYIHRYINDTSNNIMTNIRIAFLGREQEGRKRKDTYVNQNEATTYNTMLTSYLGEIYNNNNKSHSDTLES